MLGASVWSKNNADAPEGQDLTDIFNRRPKMAKIRPPQKSGLRGSPAIQSIIGVAIMKPRPTKLITLPMFFIISPLFSSCVNELVRFTFKYSRTSI